MKYIKTLYQVMNEMKDYNKTFLNTKPTEILWMEDSEIIEMISNTFESKVISNDPNWIIIESEWRILEKENEMTKLSMKEIIDDTSKVYFYILKDDFAIIRGTEDQITDFMDKAGKINPSITENSGHGESKSSTILKGRQFPKLLYALAQLPKNQDFLQKDGDFFSLSSMGTDLDIRLEDESIAYLSDLLIGSTVKLRSRDDKKYPKGMSRLDKMKASIADSNAKLKNI